MNQSKLFRSIVNTLWIILLCIGCRPALDTATPSTATATATATIPPATDIPAQPTTTPIPPTISPTVAPTNTPTLEETLWPASRVKAGAMVYDPLSQRIFMLGGIRRIGDYEGLSEVWAYDPSSNLWQQKGDLPTKIIICAAYDEESARIIVVARGTYKDSATWAYDPATDQWQEMNPEIVPRQRYGSACSYDAESDRVILFGGTPDPRPYLPYDDTWTYDYNSNTWTEMQPAIAPPPRTWQGMAYDYESDRVLMWGGILDFSAHTEDLRMWAYDTNADTWEPYPNSSDNTASWYLFGMAYHPPTDRLIIFTGTDPTFELYPSETLIDAATWAYDYNVNSWTSLAPISSPGKRAGYMMAYVPSVDKVFLFGGVIPSDFQEACHELWAYDPTTNAWANLTPDTVRP